METIGKFFLIIVFVFITSTSLTAQSLISIDPNSAQQGQSLPVAITGTSSSFTQGSCTTGGLLTSITPDNARQGQTLTVTITGVDTGFGEGETGGGWRSVTDVWFSQGSSTIAGGFWGLYHTLFFAIFDIPDDANAGKWDVHVNTVCTDGEGTYYTYHTAYDAFTITPPCTQLGDLTCDGIVNFLDLAVLANHWLEGTGP